jgi:KipI family sensor histidine kinase inhibitor
MPQRPRLVQAGDRALFIEFDERIDLDVNARVIQLAAALARDQLPGVHDIVPSFRSLAVHFDPVRTDYRRLTERIEQASSGTEPWAPSSATIVVPVCYDVSLGPDLADVARLAGLPADDVVHRHTASTYRVFMLGFLPGFAYMGPLDEQLDTPRRRVPRTRVPVGSVAIAGRQTGIYPLDAPGGWHVIGRTPLRPYDGDRAEPFLFHAGDSVRFEPISLASYQRLVSAGPVS